jgi:hypothetical protein
LLFGCGSQEETKHEKEEKTTVVEETETTEKNIKLQPIDLDNRLIGPYNVKGIEFLAPSYMKLKEDEDEFITFSCKDTGNLRVLSFSEDEEWYLEDTELWSNSVLNSFFKSCTGMKKVEKKKANLFDDKCEYSVHKAVLNDVDIKIYITNFYDSNSERVYVICYSHNDIYAYDFESDYVDILKNIKKAENKSEKTESDTLRINNAFLSTDYSGKTVLVVEYNWTNTCDEEKAFIWQIITKCFQNGVECETALFCDDVDSGEKMKEVMPGYSLTVREAYILNDMSNATIKCKEFLGSNTLIEKTFKLS